MSQKKYIIQNNPFVVPTTNGKIIKEHFGIPTNNNSELSLTHMTAPVGSIEPIQIQEFDENIAVCMPDFSMDLVNRED